MSTSFPKSKEKRPQSPSEANTSFVKNVTSRVTGLLPATITKWFSSPRGSTSNGSTQATDATDSSTEDESQESPTTTRPPAKRMRYSSPGNFNQSSTVETKCASTNTDPIQGSLYTVISPTPISDIRRDNLMSTHIHSPNDDTSEEIAQDASIFKPQHSLSVIESTNSGKRKSLYFTTQDDSLKKETSTGSGSAKDPYFKPSLLSSPFYIGRTRYGGAASSYITSPSNLQRRINVTNESNNNDSVLMSQSARQIMDLLEHYSSPLSEARRMPQVTRNPEKHNLNNSSYLGVNPYSPRPYSYKNQELYVPTVANILSIKRKSRLMDSMNAARQIIASHSSSSPEFSPYATTTDCDALDEALGDKLTTKMKTRLTRINRERNERERNEMESNTSETVPLPNVILQIDKNNLPKFTFGPIVPTSQSSSIQTPVIITPEALKRSAEIEEMQEDELKEAEKNNQVVTDTNNDNFKFSTPVPVLVETTKDSATNNKFNCGSSERFLNKTEEVKKNADQLTLSNSMELNAANKLVASQKSTDWKCLDCWVMNKTDVNTCVCCGGKKPVEIGGEKMVEKKCSVCKDCIEQSSSDKCDKCEKNTNNWDKFVVKATAAKWKCNVCWVDNNESAEKCVCCGGKNPRNDMLMAGITCEEKFVENDGQQKTEIKRKKSFDSAFKNITMTQNEKWECSLCLVRNESTRSSCICCDASKPGSAQESAKFNFHQPSEVTFKFGIQPMYQAIDIEESSMGEESETNNNILPKTSFNFGIPPKKNEEVSKPLIDKQAETPIPNFTFGASKVDPVAPVRSSIFDMPSKQTETNNNTEEKEKLQEVPQMFIPPKPEELLKVNQGVLNKPVTSHVPGMPGLIPMHLTSSAMKNDLHFSTAKSTTISNAKPQNDFKFPSIMPTGNMFAPVATTTTESTSINMPASVSMTAPTTSTTPLFQLNVTKTTTSSFFKKTEPIPNLVSTLFPKTESTTTSSESSGPLQPAFSFGVGQGATQQPTEKPKFNFGFLNNTTEAAPTFTPAFGVSTDSQGSSNAFNIPPNSIIDGNSMSGGNQPNNNITQVNTANPLTTGNSLTTSSTASMFGAPIEADNVWSTSANNIFATNTSSNPVQQLPPTFTFGTATPFTANNSGFGNTTQQAQPPQQPTQNMFGIANPANTSQPSMFGNPIQGQSAPNIFGIPQVQDNPMPMGMFGSQNASVSLNFGIPNQPIAQFEQTPIVPTPAPSAFNFGQQSTGVFGFGQSQQAGAQPEAQQQAAAQQAAAQQAAAQQAAAHQAAAQQAAAQQAAAQQAAAQQAAAQQAAAQQAGMYNFGAPALSGPQMQFTIGSAPNANTTVRRVRKAARRTQR